MQEFEALKLNRQLLNAVQEQGYTVPTPIQEKAIPQIMAGHDILGIAQTGTGKTAAYILPLLMRIKYAQGVMPRALIIAPVRELVMQIADNLRALSAYTDIRTVALYGGIGPKAQKEQLNNGVDIIVATPGRLLDLYGTHDFKPKLIEVLIIDEADKMMDMGFMPQIRQLLEVLPRKRQNLLFSATFPPRVEKLSAEFLEFPMRIEVAPQATPIETVQQALYLVPNFKTKVNLLLHLIQDQEVFNRVFVFVRTRTAAENISKFLTRKIGEQHVRVIHANKGQNTRINSMDSFREGDIRVMVATDVAARGLDIPLVSHVINFDFPVIYEDYVHRIGRTGRAHQLGAAITFMTKADQWHLVKLEKLIRMKVPVLEIPDGVYIEETPFDEEQAMLKEIDNQRKKDDPTFQGAFHEKKARPGDNKSVKSGVKAKSGPNASPKSGPRKSGPSPKSGGRKPVNRSGRSKK